MHFAAAILSRLDGLFKEVPGDFNGQRIRNDPARTAVVLNPGRMRQCDPHRLAIDEKFNVDGVGMSSSNGHNESLIQTMDLLPGPAVNGMEVCVHGKLTSLPE